MTIHPIDPLPRAEESELIIDHQLGSATALERLILANARWLRRMAFRYCGPDVPVDDLFQAGCVGLIQAADKYVPQDGTDFRAFARKIVRREMMDTVAAYQPGFSISGRSFRRHGSVKHGDRVDPNDMEYVLKSRFADRELVGQMLRSLTTRQRRVVILAYGLDGAPMNDTEIAKTLCIDRTVVNKVRNAALAELRKAFTYED